MPKIEQLCLIIVASPQEMLLAVSKYRFAPPWDEMIFASVFDNYNKLVCSSVILQQFSPYRATIGYFSHCLVEAPYNL